MLSSLDSNNFNIVGTYLDELKKFRRAYPKGNYLALKAVQPFMDNKKIAEFAKVSYDKGIAQAQEMKEETDLLIESETDSELKNGLRESYRENYEIYLPKLKEFFTTDWW